MSKGQSHGYLLHYSLLSHWERSNPEEAIDIAYTNQIIDAKDRKRGYVLKEELLRYYGTKVTPDMIGPNSCLVEYVWTTLDPDDMLDKSRQQDFINLQG